MSIILGRRLVLVSFWGSFSLVNAVIAQAVCAGVRGGVVAQPPWFSRSSAKPLLEQH